MKLIKFFAVAVLAAMTADATAQLTKDTHGWTRVELSFDAQKMKEKNNNASWDGEKQKGASIGFMKGVNITSKMPLFLDLGARLAWLHSKDEFHGGDTKTTFMNIAVPVNAAYKLSFASSPISIVPFFGPNFKFNFYGRTKTSYDNGEEKKYKWLNSDDGDARIFQFGLNLGVGVNIERFYVGYTFQPDLSSYVKHDGYKLKTINNFISLGVSF
ncbi:MAG: outer membrane beta-barrel protein [Marinilabiliaceae bacterium]